MTLCELRFQLTAFKNVFSFISLKGTVKRATKKCCCKTSCLAINMRFTILSSCLLFSFGGGCRKE